MCLDSKGFFGEVINVLIAMATEIKPQVKLHLVLEKLWVIIIGIQLV